MTSDNLPAVTRSSRISGDFDIDSVEYYDEMNRVVEEMLKGESPSAIAKMLGMKRNVVVEYINEWQNIARNTRAVQDRASDAISGADQHYSMIIKQLWDTVEEASNNSDYRVKTTILKTVADVEQKRIDMLQKAGLLENQDLAKRLVENEQKQEALMKILREVAGDCEHCRIKILKKLADITDSAHGASL